MIKQEAHTIKGIQRDLAVSKFSSEFAFDAQNIRITARDHSTLLSITNEKGNKDVTLKDKNNSIVTLQGTVIGYNVLNSYLTLFTTDNTTDRIYRLERKGDYFECIPLYTGSLGLSTENPIESIGIYETKDIQKVYWIDGKNQARVININAPEATRLGWNNTSFNFVQDLNLNEHITIKRNTNTLGVFAPGVIQYAFTYYNLYGQESNIFYTSPLSYISFDNRGGNPEEKVSNSFTITIKDPDKKFNYLRIYSIHRTSIDATPTVLNVADISINNSDTLVYVDNGTTGIQVDPTELLYIGGESIIPQTMAHKDNTLFLGNILLDNKVVSEELRNNLTTLTVNYSDRFLYNIPTINGTYPYKNTLESTYNESLDNNVPITGFHSNDWYRFGIQFQRSNGKWSEPIFIRDFKNGPDDTNTSRPIIYPKLNVGFLGEAVRAYITVPQASTNLSDEIISSAVSQGFIRARGVVVYPTLMDRDVVAQGILCPTVYNIQDRQNNAPFAQASWFSRPSQAFDVNSSFVKNDNGDIIGDWTDLNQGLEGIIITSTNSKSGIVGFTNLEYWAQPQSGLNSNVIGGAISCLGSWAEFRHNYPIPDNVNLNAEIQCITNPPYPVVPSSWFNAAVPMETKIADWVYNNQEYFYVDQSIVTMHSPEIEFDDSISNADTSKLKLRIVGRILMTGNSSDVDIQTESNGWSSVLPGFYNGSVGNNKNLSYHGIKSLISAPLYIDEVSGGSHFVGGFLVYPWHRSGPLNNSYDESDSVKKNAVLSRKKLSNLKFSAFTEYLNPWYAEISKDSYHTGISGAVIFNSNEQSLVRISAPVNSELSDLNYYGNVDKVVNVTRVDKEYHPKYSIDNPMYWGGNIVLKAQEAFSDTFHRNYAQPNWDKCNKENGYPIVAVGITRAYTEPVDPGDNIAVVVDRTNLFVNSAFTGVPTHLYSWKIDEDYNTESGNHAFSGKQVYGTEPVSIKYKSTPHAVIAFNYTTDHRQIAMPCLSDSDGNTLNPAYELKNYSTAPLPWDTNCPGTYQDTISCNNDSVGKYNYNNYGFLWLAELYNDNVENRFGGTSLEAIENNLWLPAGEPVSLIDKYDTSGNPIAKKSVDVYYTEGDTFFQRYDCLKTYPYTMEDTNSVVEIVSFMCETRINIDGRYDKNRGQVNNLIMTPENFNLINDVYTQKNNFFTYRALNYNRYSLDYFPNTITWTKEKQAGAIIDAWSNITMASTLDLDGDKGEIVSLNTFNNEIYCFQERGLSNILFNSRVQIPSSDGVPIEITNGLKVDGKRYISNTVGCNNKWSIAESPLGLYFIDNITNSIYLFNGQINSLSDNLGFRQWIGSNNSIDKWTPTEFKNFVTYYDKNNDDVYFVNNDTALVYSELLSQFTSFMSYGGVPAMFNINSDFYAIKNGKIWEQFAGYYNHIFDKYCPYSVTFVSNADEPYDKIFNTIEFRADCWTKDALGNEVLVNNHTFDTLEVWNEYQKGVSNLTNAAAKPSPLKRKFRIWRANIPRANTDWNGVKANNRDRIRNTWAYVKLSMNEDNTDRMEFHDMIVHYFV